MKSHMRNQLAYSPYSSTGGRTPSRYSLGKDQSAAGCPCLLKSIAACLIIFSAALLTGCAAGDEGAPSISSNSNAAGATATLAWDPVQDPTVSGYYVYYGTQSPGQSGSCSYQYSRFVSSPTATLTDLARDTQYYFAVSAYNGIESTCSAEISTTTPV